MGPGSCRATLCATIVGNWRESSGRSPLIPALALDYSYFGLYADTNAPVGGIIYRQSGANKEFYAPLSEWSEKLGALFPNE